MPITAETFEVDHFDVLHRGLSAAAGAFENRERQITTLSRERTQLKKEIKGLEEEVRDLPSWEQWNQLVDFVRDVDRRVKTLPELLEHLAVLEGRFNP